MKVERFETKEGLWVREVDDEGLTVKEIFIPKKKEEKSKDETKCDKCS